MTEPAAPFRQQQVCIRERLLPARVHAHNDTPQALRQLEKEGLRWSGPFAQQRDLWHVRLPEAWSIVPMGGDPRWTELLDQHDRVRAEAFIGTEPSRRSFLRVVTLADYIDLCAHRGEDVITERAWATPTRVARIVAATLAASRFELRDRPDPSYSARSPGGALDDVNQRNNRLAGLEWLAMRLKGPNSPLTRAQRQYLQLGTSKRVSRLLPGRSMGAATGRSSQR